MFFLSKEKKKVIFVLIDHLKTTIFILSDDISFSSKGQGYILRKLVKKVCLLSFLQNLEKKDLMIIIEKIIEINGSFYSKLKEKKKIIIKELESEINKQLFFIEKSVKKLESFESKKLSSKEIFFFYDTEGIPLEIIKKFLKSNKQKFPLKHFQQLLLKQKKTSQNEREKKDISIF